MSSDEEVDVTTLPLSERLQAADRQIFLGTRSKNSSSKHTKNIKKKSSRQSKKHNYSSNPLSEDQWCVPETPSPYFLSSKKRQNGDKINQVATQSKRTCLSDRFLQPEWRSSRKKNGVVDHASHSDGGPRVSPLLGASLADTTKRDVGVRSRIFPGDRLTSHTGNSSNLSEMDGPSSSLGSSSSVSNDRVIPQTNADPNAIDYSLSLPSTSRDGPSRLNDNKNLMVNSRTVNVIDSDTDSDIPSSLKMAPLKGGRQLPECFHKVKKVIGKKVQKILYSDDTSDDNDWQTKYRRPLKCPSSASEDDDIPIQTRKKKFLKYSAKISSSESNDEDVGNGTQHAVAHNTRRSALKQQSSSKRCEQSKRQPQQPTSRPISTSTTGKPTQSPQNDAGNPFLAVRNRFARNGVWARSPVTAHPRVHTSQRHPGLTRSSFNQIIGREHPHRHLASQFPDIFDAEDSSDVEFFTARSYSDTETSTEYAGNADVHRSAIQVSDHDYTTNSIPAGSSDDDDDEISIIFSSNTTTTTTGTAATGTTIREGTARRGKNRGSGIRRRRTRGSGRTSSHAVSQDVAPVSPDPVAQVRQVEDDERYARLLQSEFDAEIDETATFISMTDSDESAIIDPVGLADPVYPIDPVGYVDPMESVADVQPLEPEYRSHPPPVLSRGRSRGMHHNMAQVTGECRRRGRRIVPRIPLMWQFARVLGFGPFSHQHHHHRNHHHHHHPHLEVESHSYESLIRLTERVGDAVPRGLMKNEINRLPTRKFNIPGNASTSQTSEEVAHKRSDLNKECQVCLCDYENGDILRILPCFHEFHTPCIDPWLKINHTCPVCRVEVVFDS